MDNLNSKKWENCVLPKEKNLVGLALMFKTTKKKVRLAVCFTK